MNTNAHWDILEQILAYGVDMSDEYPLRVEGLTVSSINETAFFEQLYARRRDDDFEIRLVEAMLHSVPILCVASARGSGKTSALRFALREIGAMELPIASLLFDVKLLHQTHDFSRLEVGEAAIRFRRVIRQQLMHRLFPEPTDAACLIAWLLAGASPDSASFHETRRGVLAEFYDESLELLLRTVGPEGSRDERQARLQKYLLANQHTFAQLFTRLRDAIQPSHVVHAFIGTSTTVERLILVFDNVDVLPARYQPVFFRELSDNQVRLGEHCTTVVAIRSENLRTMEAAPGEGGDLPRYVLPTTGGPFPVFSSQSSDGHVGSVLDRRWEFASRVFANVTAQTPALTGRSTPQRLHVAVLSEVIKESLYALANGSIRSVVKFYGEFLRYVQHVEEHGQLSHEIAESRHLETLFFLFLRQTGELFDVPIEFLLDLGDPRKPAHDFSSAASEHHLLLTCVLNLTPVEAKETSPSGGPMFDEVWRRMSSLGFKFEETTKALERLCAQPGDHNGALEFFESEVELQELNQESRDRLRLTPKGRQLITSVFSKVGFMWSSAVVGAQREGVAEPSGLYLTLSSRERQEILIRYLRSRAVAHLRILELLGERWHPEHHGNWLNTYRLQFGVRHQLQAERMLESAQRFYRNQRDCHDDPFATLKSAFQECLDELQRNRTISEESYAKIHTTE